MQFQGNRLPSSRGGVIGFAAITGGNAAGMTLIGIPLGLVGSPPISPVGDATSGIWWASTTNLSIAVSGVERFRFGSGGQLASTGGYGMGSTAGSPDVVMNRAGANAAVFGTVTAAAGSVTSRTELNSAIASIADNVATAALTITIPNAAHSASVRVRVTGSAGAGGAIGANEATAANEYIVTLTRTAGVNAVAAISAAYGAGAATVAGGNAVTCTAAVSAVSGAVGATNTFTVNVTIARAAGTATNHTCLVYGQLMNANATGITIA